MDKLMDLLSHQICATIQPKHIVAWYYGQDVSDKVLFIDGLKHLKKCKIGGIIRGEAIVPINKWQEIQNKGANARNYVAGIINRKLISPQELNNIQFVHMNG